MLKFSLAKVQSTSIWPIDRTLSGATTPGQSGPWSDGNERVLHIPGTSPSDYLVSYLGHSSYPSAKKQSVYSTAPADWARETQVGWMFGFYGISTFVGYLTGNPFFMQIVLFQTIQFSMSTEFNCQKHFYFKLFSLIQLIQFRFCLYTVKCQNSSILNNLL